jgi:hypothetical protein
LSTEADCLPGIHEGNRLGFCASVNMSEMGFRESPKSIFKDGAIREGTPHMNGVKRAIVSTQRQYFL